ncbi:MAG: excinuclease ABC subunit UvrC [Alphaproteobacteria bacterium]|nr:excinuclease ABC subunit UvrC [Alphaproteobacteria bacterium]
MWHSGSCWRYHIPRAGGYWGFELADKFERVAGIIRAAANDAGLHPGVYKMLNSAGKVIYVGKAKLLKNRLLSYSRFEQLAVRTKMMVSNITSIEFIIVNSEVEALLLESNLIKQLKPFYNVLLKDDKTFPYIVIGSAHNFPRLFKYRTLKPKGKDFFGPYPAVSALDETIKVIQKTFQLRSCTDAAFERRDRPCLQFFIKRCSAPCVGKISQEEYAQNVKLARDLLYGRDEVARHTLTDQMKEAAAAQDFERAALLRDRIRSITEVQSKQYIQIDELTSIDFIAAAKSGNFAAVAVTFFRTGRNVGTEAFLIENVCEMEMPEITELFITQFYKTVAAPAAVVSNCELENASEIAEVIELSSGRQPKIIYATQGAYRRILYTTMLNAKMKLKRDTVKQYSAELQELCRLVGIKKIDRIETYDNSHIQGTNACGVMVVFENGAIQKSKARKFNISDAIAHGGDDIEMMRFSLEKRFKSKRIPELPDLIIIDGGKTQLSVALEVVSNFGLSDKVKVIGIAKQNNRRVGDEKLVLENGDEKTFGRNDELLSFLIMLRNEAHRSAITFHRKKRSRKLTLSVLDQVPGIGAVRKKALLEHFGAAEMVKNASVDDLKMVKGIDRKAAELIFDFFKQAKS